jgi:hypothetical protein
MTARASATGPSAPDRGPTAAEVPSSTAEATPAPCPVAGEQLSTFPKPGDTVAATPGARYLGYDHSCAGGVALDAEAIYWTSYAPGYPQGCSLVARMPRAGGKAVVLAASTPVARHLVIDHGQLTWTVHAEASCDALWRVPVGGGGATRIAEACDELTSPLWLRHGRLLFAHSPMTAGSFHEDGRVSFLAATDPPVATRAPRTLHTGPLTAFDADATDLYLGDAPTHHGGGATRPAKLLALPLAGGPARTVADISGDLRGVAVSEDHVYLAEPEQLSRVAKRDGTKQTLAKGGFGWLWLVGDALYALAPADQPTKLVRLPLGVPGAAAVTTVAGASREIVDVAFDASGKPFWIERCETRMDGGIETLVHAARLASVD